jgi:glyoxylase-like metal-dependent hydrolase (beta-lactamase superfamily II)
MRLVQETSNLFRLTTLRVVNCFLVKEADGFTLVDTNIPGSTRAIAKVTESLGGFIRRIVLTHAHFDHVGSVDALLTFFPKAELCVGARESRFLQGDFSLDPGERGKRLFGFLRVRARPSRLLSEGDLVESLRVVNSPGHTPGHISFLDLRDKTLLAGDSFVAQTGVLAAGTFRLFFPFAALFSWNADLSARSAESLCNLNPARLAVGHGLTVVSPGEQMKRAVEEAFRQHPHAKNAS